VGAKSTASRTAPASCWCPPCLTKTQRRRVQKLRAKELEEKKGEVERDRWFNQERPMVEATKTWREKRIAREEKVMNQVTTKGLRVVANMET
jgi:hypothetical protein